MLFTYFWHFSFIILKRFKFFKQRAMALLIDFIFAFTDVYILVDMPRGRRRDSPLEKI